MLIRALVVVMSTKARFLSTLEVQRITTPGFHTCVDIAGRLLRVDKNGGRSLIYVTTLTRLYWPALLRWLGSLREEARCYKQRRLPRNGNACQEALSLLKREVGNLDRCVKDKLDYVSIEVMAV